MKESARVSEESIQKHSKSFALASRVLPGEARLRAVALYAWCRRADDAVDLVDAGSQPEALRALSAELRDVYSGETIDDPVLALFQETVRARAIPVRYPQDLLKGMEMDVQGRRYDTMDQLLEYCYYVAGCVGLMMCHAMGVRDERALANAVHLGMAMQITNICRDVEEDWHLGRLYLPDDLLTDCGCARLADRLGEPFPAEARMPVAEAVSRLLDEADRYYRSGDAGLPALDWRCAMAIRTARSVYSSIGARLREKGCDPLSGRAIVPTARKFMLMTAAIATSGIEAPGRLFAGTAAPVTVPSRVLTFPDDVLPLEEHTSMPESPVA